MNPEANDSEPLRRDDGEPIALDVERPFLHHVTVGEHDVDQQGHVNNAVYVRWMDEAAYGHSRALGYDWSAYQKLGASFVVRRHEIDYLASAYLGERLVVATWPEQMTRSTAMRRHQVLRLGDGQMLVRALTRWVYLDLATGRPRRIPPAIADAFAPVMRGREETG